MKFAFQVLHLDIEPGPVASEAAQRPAIAQTNRDQLIAGSDLRRSGCSKACRIWSTVISLRNIGQIGADRLPSPYTMWQEAHCPLPKKNSFPAARSPGTLLPAAGALSDFTKATRASTVASGSGKAGIPAAGIPLRITLRKLCTDRLRTPGLPQAPGPVVCHERRRHGSRRKASRTFPGRRRGRPDWRFCACSKGLQPRTANSTIARRMTVCE